MNNAKCRIQNAKLSGLTPIIDKVFEKRSLALLLEEEGGPSLAMVGGPIIPFCVAKREGDTAAGGVVGSSLTVFLSVK